MLTEKEQILQSLREYFGIKVPEAFTYRKVLRIDSDEYYYLTSFYGEGNRTAKVVIVNSNFKVTHFADVRQPLILEKPEAVTAAEAHGAIGELVWKPCKISSSPFYPFWRVSLSDETYYANVDGKIYSETDLDKRRPG